jgi:plastocyanin
MIAFTRVIPSALALFLLAASAGAQPDPAPHDPAPHDMSQHQGMAMDHNVTTLPRDCPRVQAEHEFTVHAGTKYSAGYPGTIFGYSQQEFAVEPCSRVTVTFVNDDQVRHQWMVHGLPRYLYPAGMFHLEANGGESQTGSFIVPSDDRTYLVHCDLTQHMEKGMKAQLVVGRGSGDLWAIPGVSSAFNREVYLPHYTALLLLLAAAITGLSVGVWLRRRTGV